METLKSKPGIGSYIVKYGLLIAVLQIAVVILFYVLGINPLMSPVNLLHSLILYVIIIFIVRMGMVKYRDMDCDGKTSFLPLFLLGFLMLLLSGILQGLFSYFFYYIFEPGLLTQYANEVLDSFASKFSGAQLDMIEERLMGNITAEKHIRQLLISIPVSAAILSALVALFIKKDKTFPVNEA
ncbi:MAG: DUF4199 domain-containing protein [Bacteroidales bacterium]